MAQFVPVDLLYAGFILLMAWKWGGSGPTSAKSAMYLGLAFCTATFVADRMHPKPIDRSLSLWNVVTMPFADPTPVIFGILFLLAILISKEKESSQQQQQQQQHWHHDDDDESKKSPPNVPVGAVAPQCKVWSIMYLNIMALSTMATLMDPSVLYMYGSVVHDSSYRTTPRPVQRQMIRLAFSTALLKLLMAVAICVQVHCTSTATTNTTTTAVRGGGGSSSSLLCAPLLMELSHMLYIQLFYPWQSYATTSPSGGASSSSMWLLPRMVQDKNNHNIIIMPAFITSVVILVGSVVALYAQQTLDDQYDDEEEEDAAAAATAGVASSS